MDVVIILSILVCIAPVAIWNNWTGFNPYYPYASRAPIHKFYGYPLWNLIAFLSFGLIKYKSWRKEFNDELRRKNLTQYVWE